MAACWTRHARQRAAERFPGEDLEKAFKTAKPASKKVRRIIRQNSPPKVRSTSTAESPRDFYISKCERIVFVVDPPKTIVTVLRYEWHEPPRWQNKQSIRGKKLLMSNS